METLYDWVTISIMAALILLFLQRSVSDTEPSDHLWQYIIAMIGCAAANYLGNKGNDLAAAAMIAGVLGYTHRVLRPFGRAAGSGADEQRP